MIKYSTKANEGDIVFFLWGYLDHIFEGVCIARRDLDFIEVRKEYEKETGKRMVLIDPRSKMHFFNWLEDKKYVSFYREHRAKAVNLEDIQFG